MKKKGMVVVLILLMLLLFATRAVAENTTKQTSDTLIENSGIEQAADELDSQTKAFLKSVGFEEINYETLYTLNYHTVLQGILSLFRLSLKDIFRAFASIVAAVLLCALGESFCEGFHKADVRKIYDVCATLFITAVSMISLRETMSAVGAAVNAAAAFTVIAIPVICVITVSQGKALSAAVFNGMAVGVSEIICSLFSSFFLPLTGILLGVGMLGGIDSELPIDKMISLVKKYLCIALGVLASVYFSVLTLKSAVGAAADESAVKALKVAAGSFVPVIGSAISESAGVVVSSLQLTKTAIGGFGVLALTGIFLPVLIKSVLWYLTFETASVIASLFSAGSVPKILKNLSAAVSVLVIIVIFCALIFIINFGMMMSIRG